MGNLWITYLKSVLIYFVTCITFLTIKGIDKICNFALLYELNTAIHKQQTSGYIMNTIEIGTKIEFNTGRHYSEKGQIIKAVVIAINEDPDWFDEYVVLFHDTTRNIVGQVEIMEFSSDEIVDSYDRGWYTNLTCSKKEFDRHFNEEDKDLDLVKLECDIATLTPLELFEDSVVIFSEAKKANVQTKKDMTDFLKVYGQHYNSEVVSIILDFLDS